MSRKRIQHDVMPHKGKYRNRAQINFNIEQLRNQLATKSDHEWVYGRRVADAEVIEPYYDVIKRVLGRAALGALPVPAVVYLTAQNVRSLVDPQHRLDEEAYGRRVHEFAAQTLRDDDVVHLPHAGSEVKVGLTHSRLQSIKGSNRRRLTFGIEMAGSHAEGYQTLERENENIRAVFYPNDPGPRLAVRLGGLVCAGEQTVALYQQLDAIDFRLRGQSLTLGELEPIDLRA